MKKNLESDSGRGRIALTQEATKPVMVNHPPATSVSQFKDPHMMVNLMALPIAQS